MNVVNLLLEFIERKWIVDKYIFIVIVFLKEIMNCFLESFLLIEEEMFLKGSVDKGFMVYF